MAKMIVGLGLVVMMSALAFFGLVAGDAAIPVSMVNSAAPAAFWVFLVGTLIAIAGGLQGRRR